MRVVLLTHDPALADEVARLAAAGGVQPDVLSYDDALTAWPTAALVLVGADLAEALSGLAPARREEVHVVALGHQGDGVFRAAMGLGAQSVAELPGAEAWLVELLTDVGERPLRGLTLGVLGGAGGAGASTLACALAQIAAESGPALLMDADPLGAGLDRMLGMELLDGARWADLASSPGRLSARALRESVPRAGQLGVLGWGADPPAGLEAATARHVLAAAARGHEAVVLDLGRVATPLTTDLASRCEALVVVAPASVVGLASTCRVLGSLGGLADRCAVVLRHGSVVAEEVEVMTGRPVLAVVREQRGLSEALDLGMGPVRSRRSVLGRVAHEVLGSFA